MEKRNTWEVCPLCNGSGSRNFDKGMGELLSRLSDKSLQQFYDGGHDKCPVCKGKKIISSLTGLPPQ